MSQQPFAIQNVSVSASPSAAPRILVVDDDIEVRTYLVDALSCYGYEVIAVSDGGAAISHVSREGAPDVIISDVNMPRVDGLELLDWMREGHLTRDVPIIMLSGSSERCLAGLEFGADDYVRKPLDVSELAARIRVQLRRGDVIRKLRQQADFDELTCARSRRGVLQALETELERARRAERPVSVMLVDVDHFKPINDTYGHLVGDQVLRDLVGKLCDAVRLTDVVGRLGGDEFLIVLPEVDTERATAVVERIVASACEVRVGPSNAPVSISIGHAVYRGDKNTGICAEEILELADARMYQHKQRRGAARAPSHADDANRVAA